MRPKPALVASLVIILILLAGTAPGTIPSAAAPSFPGIPYRPTPGISRLQSDGTSLPGSAGLLEPNPLVQEMLSQVDEETVVQYAGDLSGEWPVSIGGEPYTLVSRNSYSGEPIQKAAQYLFEFYQELGLEVAYHDFPLGELNLSNVVAERAGSVAPHKVLLLASHYDNNPRGPLAPGADDNASGTVAVMLAAEILSQYEVSCTLRFANFAGEEQGLVGSGHYARASYCSGEDVQGVINLDMIAWNSAGSSPEMELHARETVPGSLELAELYRQVIETYGLDLDPQIVTPGISASDQAAFWKYGTPAILAIEDLDDFNPNYHESTDSLDNLEDLAYFTDMVKASLATFAHMGCLVEDGWGSLEGSLYDDWSGRTVPGARVSLEYPAWGVTLEVTADGNGRYYRQLPAGEYSLSAYAPGYARTPPQAIQISPGETTMLYIPLDPAQGGAHFLPLVQDRPEEPVVVCP